MLRRSASQCADYIHALTNRAASLKSLARNEEALAGYEAILAAKPDNIDALNECGGLLCAARTP